MKRPQVIMVAAAAIMLGVLWLTYTSDREPHYQGKSLTEWLDLCYKSSAAIPEAVDAVRHIGTDAVPFLVTWVQQDRPMSPRETRWWEKVGRWKSGTPGRELLLEFINRRRWEAQRASWGFAILGGTARGAAPDLVRIATHGSVDSANLAVAALCYLGRDGLEPLFSVLTNTNVPRRTRIGGLYTLRQMPYLATNARPAIALMTSCLRDPEPDVVDAAATILTALHQESDVDVCVPALIECARSTNELVRLSCAHHLMAFGPSARAAVPELTRLLSDPATSVRMTATNALNAIAPEVLGQKEGR